MIGMDVLERFRQDIKAGGGRRFEEIAQATGVRRGTLRNIYYGQVKNTGYRNVEALRAFYELFELEA
jgi:hypothetical protein